MKKHLITSLFLVFCLNTFSQTQYFFKENFEEKNGKIFENRMIDEGWDNLTISGNKSWRFENGGHTQNTTVPNSRRPQKAHSGNYNALFEAQTLTSHVCRLITPPFDLSNATKPTLNFWFANDERNLMSRQHDKIKVYYHSDNQAKNEWVLIYQVLEKHPQWTKATIPIPDSAKTNNFQLAFEGISGPGWGACIDDIEVIETAKTPKYFHNIAISQAYVDYFIPTGSKNNPILRLDLAVKGNENTLKITKLVIDALEQSNEVVPSNGVKLFFTQTSYFSPQKQIATGVSFVNGQATFTNIDFDFPFGYSYLWVTYDIGTSSTHDFNNKKVDGKIQKNNLLVNGSTYLSADLDPNYNRQIKEAIFFDDFEDEKKWDLTGEFEIDSPKGKGGTITGNPDPSFAQSGIKVLGTDLNGLGTSSGDYEANLTNETAYTATLKNTINCKFYKDVEMLYYRWLNVDVSDSAIIKISNDNKANWESVWRNHTAFSEERWNQESLYIGDLAYRKEKVSPQFILGPTNNTLNYSGWNIDDFAIVGTFIKYDAGILAWISPKEGCGHTVPEPISVTVKNFGYEALTADIPIGYSIDGGQTWVKENVNKALAQGETTDFTFTNKIDITTPGEHHILVKTFLPNDLDDLNDMIDTIIYVLPSKTLPYAENFENGHGFWRASKTDSSTWELGKPRGTKLNAAFSGIHAWGTNLSGNYKNNDKSWIESPCLDFTDIEKPIFEAMIAGDCEAGKDGLALYYSIDNGKTWKHAPKAESYDWNWATTDISALSNKGWDNTPKNDYQMVRQTLPDETANVNPVKIRLMFASDAQNTNEGFLIDDIRVYDAPIDVSPSTLVSPANACNLSNSETVKFKIKNAGIRKLKPKDIIYASLMQEDTLIVSDTFNISTPVDINGEVQFAFSKTIDVGKNGLHNIKIYTHAPNDSNIYNGVNDTLTTQVRMQGEPEYTLGPKIGTLNPNSVNIDAGAGYTSYLWEAPSGNTNDGATTQKITNVGEGTFSVTVTNNYNCQASASVEVVRSITDLGVTAINGISSTCPTNTPAEMKITIKNFSKDTTYRAGDKIKIAYQINDEAPVVEEYTIAEGDSIAKDTTREYTFQNQAVFSVSGEKVIKCFSVFQPDLDYSNDTTTQTIEVYELPKIDLGQDTIFTDMANTIELDAGSGLNNYQWQDGTTNQKFTINSKKSKMYTVQAQDMNSCGVAHDTVWVITDNWGIDTVMNPKNTCNGTNSENITLRLKNNSENIYATGYKIPIQIKLNNVLKEETISLTSEVGSKGTYVHILTEKLDMSQKGIYNFEAKINPIYDIDTNNNVDKIRIENYEVPKVKLNYRDTIFTKKADSILLDASDKFKIYVWKKGEDNVGNNSTYKIQDKQSALYTISTQDKNKCATTKDSVRIMASDLKITEIISPRRSCKLEDVNRISFKLRNEGNDIIRGGTPMSIWYNINNSAWIEKTFSLPEDLKPEQEKQISVIENLSFEKNKTYDFSLVIRYSKDFFTNNDTIKTKVYELENPSINLGADIFTSRPDTVKLDAGSGLLYLWQDGSTEQVYKVQKEYTQNYSVVVSNTFGCTATDTVLVFTKDVSLEMVTGHESSCQVEEKEIAVDIKISGKDTLFNDSFKVWIKLDDNEKITEEGTVSTKTGAENPFRYTFGNKIAITDTGSHILKAGIIFTNDVNLQNNEVSTQFRIGPILANLGKDIKTSASEYILNPGNFKTYKWNDGSTQPTQTVTQSGKYWVQVTDSNGCESSDTINISFVEPKYKITEIVGLSDACLSNEGKTLSFSFKNEGTDTLQVGENIKITYQVNTKVPIEENYTFAEKLDPDKQIKISFSKQIVFSEVEQQKIKINVLQANNSLAIADTTINIFALPTIDLGENVRTLERSHTIDAGNGFSSYLWNTGETSQTIKVTKNGTYKVSVTNANGCESSDSISVFFVPIILSIEPIGDLSKCIPADKTIKINLKNSGEKEIKAGAKFVLGYQLADEKRVNEPIEVKEKIESGKSFAYNFKKPIQIKTAGSYPISFFINFEEVDIDTTKFTFEAKESHVFAFNTDTLKVSSYPHELKADVTADAYLWNNGQTTPSIQVEKDGLYTLTAIHNNGCRFSDSVFVINLSSINDEWSKKVRIYPNPASEKLTIELPEFIERTSIEITTINGKLVQKEDNVSEKHIIDLENYKQGVYFVTIKNIEHYAVFKLVVH